MKNIVKEIQSDVSVDFIQKTVGDYFRRAGSDERQGKEARNRYPPSGGHVFLQTLYPALRRPDRCKILAVVTTARLSTPRVGGGYDEIDPNFKNSVEELTK